MKKLFKNMTENVNVVSSILNTTSLPEVVSTTSNVATTSSELEGAFYLSPNMMVDGSCIFTTNDITGNFADGTVLQILADSTILAVPPVNESSTSTLGNATIIFKDPSLDAEFSAGQKSLGTMQNLLVSGVEDKSQASISEGNISDIDLSFLNDTDESAAAIQNAKALCENAIKEFQGIISATPPNPLDGLHNNMQDSGNENQCFELQADETPKEPETAAENVVLIDVSKPIQLSQNALIMVNGQKCVLQQDIQTGQVVAYPIKEQEKPRRRRGRPRKSSPSQTVEEAVPNPSLTPVEAENSSDEAKEKGLFETVNDDGSLVKRSARKRKRAKVYKDYETGNLKQELGSDIEDVDGIEDMEVHTRKRKSRNVTKPGRPRKYPLSIPIPTTDSSQTDLVPKRPRGRPRKHVTPTEPTQAFLVQTADGQSLMMQVPLSSIPPGVTLQEVAQNIANRLNIGLTQNATTTTTEVQRLLQPLEKDTTTPNLPPISEPVVQDHSIGSTTNVSGVDSIADIGNEENIVENACQNVTTSSVDVTVDGTAANVTVQPVCDSQANEVSLIGDNSEFNSSQPSNLLANNFPDNQSNESFSLDVATSLSSHILNPEQSNPQPISTKINQPVPNEINLPISNDQELDLSYASSLQIPSDFLLTGDFSKDHQNLQQLLEKAISNAELTKTFPDKDGTSKNLSSSNIPSSDIFLNAASNLKDFPSNFEVPIDRPSSLDVQQSFVSQSGSADDETKTRQGFDFLADPDDSRLESSDTHNNLSQAQSIIYSIEHDHNLLVQKSSADNSGIYSIEHDHNLLVQKSSADNSGVSSQLELGSKDVKKQIYPSSLSIGSELELGCDDKAVKKQTYQSTFPIGSQIELDCSDKAVKKQTHPSILPIEKLASILASGENPITVPTTSIVQVSDKLIPVTLSPRDLSGLKKCRICEKPYFTNEEIVRHFKAKHPRCICHTCHYMADHPYIIKRHSVRHTQNGVGCTICGKRYKDHYILKMHMKMVHLPADVLYSCEICDKEFTRKAHLKRHLRIHAPNRAFKCSFCSYRGCEKSDITKHHLIHQAPKHKCHVCGKEFRHVKNKELHVKRHLQQRDYKCGFCDYFGYTFTDIRKHIERRHQEGKNCSCGDCGTVFSNRDLLTRHKESGGCQKIAVDQHVLKLKNLEMDEMKHETNEESCLIETSSLTEHEDSHSNQLIMTSDNEVINISNSSIVIGELEDTDVLSSENYSLVGNDSNRLVTLVTSDGKNFTVPLRALSSIEALQESIEALQGSVEVDQDPGDESVILSVVENEVETLS